MSKFSKFKLSSQEMQAISGGGEPITVGVVLTAGGLVVVSFGVGVAIGYTISSSIFG